ncbi:MAG TPA: sulfur globule protein precursor [Xanthobacteraceae bacterium]|nr:sulfur globule protein precursor [Xanthobacteraceae bacterium]
MLRKIVMVLAASATLALAAAPTDASAWVRGGWHGGWHAGWHGRFVRFHRFGFFPHRHFFVARGYPWHGYGGCWRWVAGPWRVHRVWVCGPGPYAY